jgi:murein L,D-transpeptidase YcbB/YkuD
MIFLRIKVLTLFAMFTFFSVNIAFANSVSERISNYLYSGLSNLNQCSEEYAALYSTAKRLKDFDFYENGKFVMVNIAGGFLTAYENGKAVLEMKVIVGKEKHQTPEQQTRISSVRFNPTWTVPPSIVKEQNYRKRVQTETQFFLRNKFEFRGSNNELISVRDAVNNPSQITRFVQSPGDHNALGRFRFNIQSSQSIFLHDTRDPERFYDGSPITLSHGCVRLEKPQEFTRWLTGFSDSKIESILKEGSTYDLAIDEDIPVVLGYFTAWPNHKGEIIVYDDIYDKDQNMCEN